MKPPPVESNCRFAQSIANMFLITSNTAGESSTCHERFHDLKRELGGARLCGVHQRVHKRRVGASQLVGGPCDNRQLSGGTARNLCLGCERQRVNKAIALGTQREGAAMLGPQRGGAAAVLSWQGDGAADVLGLQRDAAAAL
eukprot:364344-Chlamydomonas_euryale.AAC.16